MLYSVDDDTFERTQLDGWQNSFPTFPGLCPVTVAHFQNGLGPNLEAWQKASGQILFLYFVILVTV